MVLLHYYYDLVRYHKNNASEEIRFRTIPLVYVHYPYDTTGSFKLTPFITGAPAHTKAHRGIIVDRELLNPRPADSTNCIEQNAVP